MSKTANTRMRQSLSTIFVAVCLAFILVARLRPSPSENPARPPGGQWITFGHDPQRTGWAADETAFTREKVARLGLVWNATLPNEPRALNGLTAPLVVRDVATAAGFKTMVIVAGSSDHLFALDAETGATLWTAHLPVPGKGRSAGDWLCPNALNATPVIDTERERVFAIASDGQLHTFALSDGRPRQPSFRFVPAYSKMWSLNYVGGVLYTTLGQDCNGGRSGFYALDPDAPGHPVTTFWTELECGRGFCGAGAWGRGGAAIDFDGFAYAATGDGPFNPAAGGLANSVVRVAPRTLTLADYYTPSNWQEITKLDLDMGTTTPVIFRWRNRVLAAVGGKEGVIYLMDTRSLGGADHHKALYVSPRYSNDAQTFEKNGIWGSLSYWRDRAGDAWLYVPTWGPVAAKAPPFPRSYGSITQGSIMAFKVVANESGQPILQPGWLSRDLVAPQPVAIAGDVVFALESGENTEQVIKGDIRQIIKDRNPLMHGRARLFALDAETGRELWSSDTVINGWTHFSGLAVGAGKIFVTTHSGGVYAFALTSGQRTTLVPLNVPAPPSPAAAAPADKPALRAEASPAGNINCAGVIDLFQQKCALCHGPEGKGMASTHTPDFTDPRWQSARTHTALVDAILNGKEGEGLMPAFKGKLTAEQADQLVRCVIRRFGAAQK